MWGGFFFAPHTCGGDSENFSHSWGGFKKFAHLWGSGGKCPLPTCGGDPKNYPHVGGNQKVLPTCGGGSKKCLQCWGCLPHAPRRKIRDPLSPFRAAPKELASVVGRQGSWVDRELVTSHACTRSQSSPAAPSTHQPRPMWAWLAPPSLPFVNGRPASCRDK